MEELEDGAVVFTENEYDNVMYDDDIPPPPSHPPTPLPSHPTTPLPLHPSTPLPLHSSSVDTEEEERDGFVQRNPLAQLEEESDRLKHAAVDGPTTEHHQPQVITAPHGEGIFSPAVQENARDDVDKAKMEVGFAPLATTAAQYSTRYIGSIRLPEGDLVGDRCASTLTECIITVSKGSKKTDKVIHEFKQNQKVILKLEDRELKLTTDEKNAKTISCHLLRKIRAWAVGKETNSHHFAYVIRSPDESAGYSYVCRVFKCSVNAREIATAFRNICQQRAAIKAVKNQ